MKASFAPTGLFFIFACYPTLTPWAVIFRRFAASLSLLLRSRSHREQSSFARRTADGGCPHINFYIKNYR